MKVLSQQDNCVCKDFQGEQFLMLQFFAELCTELGHDDGRSHRQDLHVEEDILGLVNDAPLNIREMLRKLRLSQFAPLSFPKGSTVISS